MVTKQIMYVEGTDGQVELLADRIIIHRKGWWNVAKFGLNSKREIPLGSISEVMFRPANTIVFGRIEFIRAGRSADERKKDYNAVKFGKKTQPEFEALKEKIFELVEQYNRNRQ